jgi:hypothetical protein
VKGALDPRGPDQSVIQRDFSSAALLVHVRLHHIFSQNLVNYFNPAFSWYTHPFPFAGLPIAALPSLLNGQLCTAKGVPLVLLQNAGTSTQPSAVAIHSHIALIERRRSSGLRRTTQPEPSHTCLIG